MKKDQIRQLKQEEIKRRRKRLFFEGASPIAPTSQPAAPQQPQQSQPAPAPEPTNAGPTLDAKKAHGIIVGAVKTLFNSGALTGVGIEQLESMTQDVIKQMTTSIGATPAAPAAPTEAPAPAPTAAPTPAAAPLPTPDDSEEDDPEFDDQVVHDQQADELDDQAQYDPDLDKQVSSPAGDESYPEEEPEEEEPLFEVKDIKKILGIKQL